MSRHRGAVCTSMISKVYPTGAPAARPRFRCWEGLDTRDSPLAFSGNPQASAKAGQSRNQSLISCYDRRHRVLSKAISSNVSSV
jgi:hypothetical protein